MKIVGEMEEPLSSFKCLFTTKHGRRLLRYKVKNFVFHYCRRIFEHLIIKDDIEKMILDTDEWEGMKSLNLLIKGLNRSFYSCSKFITQEASLFELRIALEGDSGVGKSSFVKCVRGEPVSFCNQTRTIPNFSIMDCYLKDSHIAKIHILDSPNPKVYPRIPYMFLRRCTLLLILFDVTCRTSFERISKISKGYVEQLREKNEDTEVVIIGTKIDIDESLREVSFFEATELAFKQFNGSLYFEISNTEIEQQITLIWYCLFQKYLLHNSVSN